MLTVVAFRNLIELSGTESDLTEGFILPKSFGWFRGNNVIWTISYVMLLLLQFDVFLYKLLSIVACAHRDDFRDARGLAQTCFHNQIQPHSTVSLRAVY
jgi:hypothetical protein